MVLDRWDAEQYEIMKLLGNRRANAYWEADLPREFLKVRRTRGTQKGKAQASREREGNTEEKDKRSQRGRERESEESSKRTRMIYSMS